MSLFSLASVGLYPVRPSSRLCTSSSARVGVTSLWTGGERRNRSFGRLRTNATTPDPEQLKKMQEQMSAAMQNPQLRERMNQMQEAIKNNPEVRQQLEQTMAYMQSEETQKRIKEMREDPEFKEKFDEMQKGGIGAVMKAMSDTAFLEKVGRRVGGPPGMAPPPPQPTTTPEAPPPASPPAEPEINTLLDGAKYGDLEAVEDFLAIGKDPNLVDEYNRSPLHFAVCIEHMEIVEALLSAGAKLELKDSKLNTPLHYAAGYGRVKAVRCLLEAGADGSVKNENGKSPADVARLSEQNPILQEQDLISKLDELAGTQQQS